MQMQILPVQLSSLAFLGTLNVDPNWLISPGWFVKGISSGPPDSCSLSHYYKGVEHACLTLRKILQDPSVWVCSLESFTYLPAMDMIKMVNPDDQDAIRFQTVGLIDLEACVNRGREVNSNAFTALILEKLHSGIPQGNSIEERSFVLGVIDALMEIDLYARLDDCEKKAFHVSGWGLHPWLCKGIRNLSIRSQSMILLLERVYRPQEMPESFVLDRAISPEIVEELVGRFHLPSAGDVSSYATGWFEAAIQLKKLALQKSTVSLAQILTLTDFGNDDSTRAAGYRDAIVAMISIGALPGPNSFEEYQTICSLDQIVYCTFNGRVRHFRYTPEGERTAFVGATVVDRLVVNFATVAAIAENCSEFGGWERDSK